MCLGVRLYWSVHMCHHTHFHSHLFMRHQFHVAVNTYLNVLLECPATSESDATLSQLATQLLGAGDEAMKMFEYTYR